ncbi:phospholipase effector Tle1 domain-containing protein [Vibrio sp. E150_011]
MTAFHVFSFDGTGNEPADAKQKVEGLVKQEDNNISNVLKLHLMMGGNLFLEGEQYGKSQQNTINNCFYYQGVGTYGGWLNRVINQGLAPERYNVAAILNKAKVDFNAHYQLGDEILVIGFSRGAALARRFVNIIGKEHSSQGEHTTPFVFLCVFDTVASIGLPDLNTRKRPAYDVVFEHGCTLAPTVKQAVHLVSLDEKRKAFQPTLMNHEARRVHEIWFLGAHSDVGGGYYRDGLSDIALSHAIKWLEHMSRDNTCPSLRFILPSQASIDAACPESIKGMIGVDDLQRNPNPMGKNHRQKRWPIIDNLTLHDRQCCVIQGDDINPSLRPLIHNSVAERVHRDDNYRSKSLLNTPHNIWYDFVNTPIECPNLTTHIDASSVNWTVLDKGETVTRVVAAEQYYNFTGILVEQGERYQITVVEGDQWHDGADISCDGDGWNCDVVRLGIAELPIRMLKKLRRVPEADWFTLCAAVGSEEANAKAVGQNGDYQVTATGELKLFANDLSIKYGNNSGSLRVLIERC